MADTSRSARHPAAIAAFTAMASYMLISPALPQLFDAGRPFIRQWTMFSGVGVGLPKGTFTLEHADGRREELTPLAAAGLSRYPVRRPIYRFEGYGQGAENLPRYAAATCTHLPEGAKLRFEGVIAEKYHWYRVEDMVVCEVPA